MAAPDDNVWFVESETNKLAKAISSGSFTEYTIPISNGFSWDIVAGPDGNLWFTESATDKLTKVIIAQSFTEYSLSDGSAPCGKSIGGDSNL